MKLKRSDPRSIHPTGSVYAKLTGSAPEQPGDSPLFKQYGHCRLTRVGCRVRHRGADPGSGELTQHVTGHRSHRAMIDQAARCRPKPVSTNVDWQVGDVLPLPFPDGAFSLVVSQAAFHHLTDPAAVTCRDGARVRNAAAGSRSNDVCPTPTKATPSTGAENSGTLPCPERCRRKNCAHWESRRCGNGHFLTSQLRRFRWSDTRNLLSESRRP